MTGRIIPMPGDAHREAQALLPWYLLGGLDEAERARVKAHVSQCAECQAELADEPRLAEAVAGLQPAEAGLDVEHGWRQISRAMGDAPPRRGPVAAWLGRLIAGPSRPATSRRGEGAWLRWAVAAQFLVLALLSVTLWRTTQPARYQTLGAPPASAMANVVVIFRPQTTEKDFRAILRSNEARLVDGPTVADAYLVHVSGADRAQVLANLRRQPQVVLAEPLDGEATR
jgi:hypothetical protein